MALAEGVQARLAFKPYASGVFSTNTKAVSSSALGTTGGQILRRAGSTLKLGKDTFQAKEIRTDRQKVDFRHGVARGSGGITGDFSPGTYFELLEAAMRTTKEAAVDFTHTDFTSVSADLTTSKFTFGAGDPVALGLRVGHILRFQNLSDVDNNDRNFFVMSFGGASNREVTVYPPPDTMGADTAFSGTSVGKRLYIPSTGFITRKFGFEEYHSDIDLARLYTEWRMSGMNINLPANDTASIELMGMGRFMEIYEDSNAPFFTNPAAETETGIFAAVNGLLQVAGATIGVVTGLQIKMEDPPEANAVVGQNFVPEVFLGASNVTGQLTADLEDGTFFNDFMDESEISVLCYLTTSNDDAAEAVTIYLPRIKLTDVDSPLQGEGGQTQTIPFQALKYIGSTPGVQNTTIQICDTEGV